MTYAPSSSDQQLLAAIARSDEAAFDALFTRHYTGLLRYAKSLLPYPTDAAEDVTADVFCTLWTNRAQLVVQGSVAAYLYAAVRHRSFDKLRQQRRAAQEIDVTDELPPHQPDAAHLRPDELLSYHELHTHLLQRIGQLPARTRQVFELHRDAGLTYEEIADLLNISLNSVKTHMFRALRFLKEGLHASRTR